MVYVRVSVTVLLFALLALLVLESGWLQAALPVLGLGAAAYIIW